MNKIQTEGTKPELTLTTKQQAAIVAILETDTMEEAAEKVQTSRQTLYRMLKDPVFKSELEKARRTVFDEALSRLKTASTKAVKTLIKGLDAKTSTEKRLAASEILDLAFKAIELQEFSSRLSELEETILISRRVS